MNQTGPIRLASPSELAFQLNANGSIRRIDHRDVIVNTYLGNELEGGPANLYLRRRGDGIEWTPLLGPRAPGAVHLDAQGFAVAGTWSGVRFHVSLVLAASAPAWFWHVELENEGPAADFDLIWAQDVALADYGAVRLNEYYVSQYLDHTPLAHAKCGTAIAVRQNLGVGGRIPWLVLGSLGRGVSFSTDALQLHGLATRAGEAPEGIASAQLPGVRLQHEHALVAIQDEPLRLATGARATRGFFGWFEPDHPTATSDLDVSSIDRALALPEATALPAESTAAPAPPATTLFSDTPLLEVQELDATALEAAFGSERSAVEQDGGRLLSFFAPGAAHVVLPAKEKAGLRPHGQILRTGDQLVPDEASLTTTVWMGGVFHSMLTQGHVSIGRLLSTTHSYLGLFRSHGQRIFVDAGDGWRLLGTPSAFEMTPSSARWIYAHAGGLLEVRSWASTAAHEMWLSARVLRGAPCRFLVSHHLAVNGDDGSDLVPARWTHDADGIAIGLLPDTDLGRRFPDGGFRIDLAPETAIETIGGDELLFADGHSRGQPFVVLITAPSEAIGLRITGQLVASAPSLPAGAADPRAETADAATFWREMTGALSFEAGAPAQARHFEAVLPWFAHDAWIHHLAPRGLEQYSGGGWGTRDVCQGPVELLLALGRTEPIRDLLLRVFRNQNADGDWPQWFMFFERERGIRPGDSHGDIVFWPLLALAQYLIASGDAAVLHEELPFFHPEGDAKAELAGVLGHVERAIALIEKRVIPGTHLAAYGHGDWNDSMQPADPALAEQLCSAWTVTLHYLTFATLAEALRGAGEAALAARLASALEPIRADFQRLLVVDGVLTGLARFHDGRVDPWLHPSDRDTGVHYSLLPMIHAVLANLLTREQAALHVALIRENLMGADGARLFDRPLPYHGGIMHKFQRAETSTFFGREIGLMYTHAHLRWAEALAHLGDAEAFWVALQQANPVGLRAVVSNARLRQSNCYTSSSDAAFRDRADASARYDAVRTRSVAVEGGWRVYSSGAGISVRLIRERLLGLRLRHDAIGIDPVLPQQLNGLCVSTRIDGRAVRLRYRVGPRGHGPTALTLNGSPLAFAREDNPYRTGGVVVAMQALRERLRGDDELLVEIG